jgi:hypothetical protein
MRTALLSLSLLSAAALLSAATVMVGCAGSDDEEGAAAAAADLSSVKVSVENSASLGLNEVSGLGVRTVSGKPQYLAIGDSSTTLLTFNIGADGKPTSIKKNDLAPIFGGGDSQWEAVAGDSTGKVFIENESEATISVLDADLKLKHVISLTIPKDNPLYPSWDRDENSRGEGMLLLSNGHILIAKEKGPSAIIEFAPKGQDAKGYTAALQLKGAFKVPSGDSSEFVAVKNWELKSDAAHLIGDISDLTTDADGSIIVLSDQSRAIARIEKELSVDEDKIDLKAIWNLPREVDKPEGLQLVDGKPFVACDLPKADMTSFFSISAL